MVGAHVPTTGRANRSVTVALAFEPFRETRPAANVAAPGLVVPRALSAATLTVAKSAGGSATWRRIAVQSCDCHAVTNAVSVACGVEEEPPHADNPTAAVSATATAVNRDIRCSRTPARIGGEVRARARNRCNDGIAAAKHPHLLMSNTYD